MTDHVKVHFRLEQDEDGYPPVSVESLWAVPTDRPHEYVLDNIPFFASQATIDDVVQAKEEEGVLWFDRVVKPSGNSLLRLAFFRPDKIQEVREALKQLGCSSEWDSNHAIVAVNIPASATLESIQALLAEQAQAGYFDYEEPILRQ